MAREINDYQDLQDAVKDWLNRDDLIGRIPTFIYLAERKIFRRYRTPNNEKTILVQQRATPNPPDEVIVSDVIDIPNDYLETLNLQWNGKPLTRVSLTNLMNRQHVSGQGTTPGIVQQDEPQVFARNRGNIVLWPFPVGDADIMWIYYCDFSGNLINPSDDNTVLWTAPDLYLYGALLQAQPFLKPQDQEWQLIPVWQKYYEDAFGLVEYQRDEDERSGSNVEIQSSFGSGASVRTNFGGNA